VAVRQGDLPEGVQFEEALQENLNKVNQFYLDKMQELTLAFDALTKKVNPVFIPSSSHFYPVSIPHIPGFLFSFFFFHLTIPRNDFLSSIPISRLIPHPTLSLQHPPIFLHFTPTCTHFPASHIPGLCG